MVIEGVAESESGMGIALPLAPGKLVHAGVSVMGIDGRLACVKMSPGGGADKGIADSLAAGKMVAEGELVLVIAGYLAFGKL